MPKTKVVFYREDDSSVPVLDWLTGLSDRAKDRCVARLARLAQLGYELRRPEADFVVDGIYELRAKCSGINFRILYFFYGQQAVVVSHGFVKQQARVPGREIQLCRRRKSSFELFPEKHMEEFRIVEE